MKIMGEFQELLRILSFVLWISYKFEENIMKYETSISDSQKFKRYLALWQQHDSANKKQALTNPEADPMLLEILCSDKDEEIILQAAQHANHNEHSLERLAQHSHTLVRQSVAKHRNSNGHILLSLLNDEDATVTFLAIQSIVNSDNASAKLKLLKHHNHHLEQDILEALQQDANGQVRLYAYEILQQHYQNTLEVFYTLQDTKLHANIISTDDSDTLSEAFNGMELQTIACDKTAFSVGEQFHEDVDEGFLNTEDDVAQALNDKYFEDYDAAISKEILNDVTFENKASLEPSSTDMDILPTQEEAISANKSYMATYFETDVATDALANDNVNGTDLYFDLLALQDNLILTQPESQKITEQLLRDRADDEEKLYHRVQKLLHTTGLHSTDEMAETSEQLVSILEHRKEDFIGKAYLSLLRQGYILNLDNILVASMIKSICESYDKYNHLYYNRYAEQYVGYVITWEEALRLSHAFSIRPNLENLQIFFAKHYEHYTKCIADAPDNKSSFIDYLLELADEQKSLDTFNISFYGS